MIDINSNCSRVDAVKASANHLKMQIDQTPHSVPESDSYRKAQNQIQALATVVQQDDAQKAETALSMLKSTVNTLQTQSAAPVNPARGLDAYA